MMHRPLYILLGLLATHSTSWADNLQPVKKDVLACSQLPDATARLRCFDLLAGRYNKGESQKLTRKTDPRVQNKIASNAIPLRDPAAIAVFGLIDKQPVKLESPFYYIEAIVTSVNINPKKPAIIKLNNKQTWVQLSHTDENVEFDMPVRIEQISKHAYVLSTVQRQGQIRVKRIK